MRKFYFLGGEDFFELGEDSVVEEGAGLLSVFPLVSDLESGLGSVSDFGGFPLSE